nr:dTDP-4-dehydrorhamnose 3,5-epimerase family protein [candidate division Zixibacteria bacterium]
MEIKCDIAGVIIKRSKRYEDKRGWLAELFREDELPEGFRPAMGYISMTRPGQVRGPHEHRYQTDHFTFLGGAFFLVYMWDNRPDSPGFGRHCRIDIGVDELITLIIPPGVVHAYKNIGSTEGLIFNTPDRLYAGRNKAEKPDEIRYEDCDDTNFIIDD